MGKRRPKTAEELKSELEADPGFRERTTAQRQRQAERNAPIEAENRELCLELSKIGIEAESVYDLLNTELHIPAAVPLLLDWLAKSRQPQVREGIVRALTFKRAGRKAGRALIAAFENGENSGMRFTGVKWALGNAIAETADVTMLDDLMRLALEKRHGSARQMVVTAIGKLGKKNKDRAMEALLSLLDDPIVQGHVLIGLRYLNDERSRAAIEPFLEHETSWIRAEAKKALARLDKASRR